MPHPAIFPPDAARRRPHQRGFSLPYVNRQTGSSHFTIHMSVINPGERAHPPHDHPDEEVLFLLEGAAEALIGDHTEVIGVDTAVFCPPNVTHGLRNVGGTPLRYLVIRTGAAS
ncbi:MAG TPA: cupin domain-containing protein [Chloroflexota bacterium]|nr:cupin domain-containing protein [Chloroflexota bacterium]